MTAWAGFDCMYINMSQSTTKLIKARLSMSERDLNLSFAKMSLKFKICKFMN